MKKLKIAIITPEAAPFVNNGTLSEFSASLSRETASLGHEVLLMMPLYGEIDSKLIAPENCTGKLTVPFGFGEKYAAVRRSSAIAGVKTYLIEHNSYFERKGLYEDGGNEFGDNAERFTFFSRAALQALTALNFKPDVIHCNDWQTGLIPLYLKGMYRDQFNFINTKTLFTVHDMRKQGVFSKDSIFFSQLGWEAFNEECLKFYDSINFLKSGLLFSDLITTVSRKYAEEIMTAQYGFDLSGILRKRGNDLHGILNGLDSSVWDPASDIRLPSNYSPAKPAGKGECKRFLQNELSLPLKPDAPLICSISDITVEKGMDQLAAVIGNILTANRNLQIIINGSGDEQIMNRFRILKKLYPQNAVFIEEKNHLMEHKILAASDIYIQPSPYETDAGLVLAAMKYGAVPSVNSAGGTDDAVIPWNSDKKTGNGFKFRSIESMPLLQSVNSMLDEFNNKEKWQALTENTMNFRYTWKDTALKYDKIYSSLIKTIFTS